MSNVFVCKDASGIKRRLFTVPSDKAHKLMKMMVKTEPVHKDGSVIYHYRNPEIYYLVEMA